MLAVTGAAVALGILVLIKDVSGSTENEAFAFAVCHGHDRLLF